MYEDSEISVINEQNNDSISEQTENSNIEFSTNYSGKEELISSMYNVILHHFIKSVTQVSNDLIHSNTYYSDLESIDMENNILYEKQYNNRETGEEEINRDMSSIRKLQIMGRNKRCTMTLINNNVYSGYINRYMMNGDGEYKWNNGGQFKANTITGKGVLEWANDCLYEGDVLEGYPHGKGIIVNEKNRFMYTGEWHMGFKNGKGCCCNDTNGSFDGDWVMNKIEGNGTRNYQNGGRYIGQWKSDLKHGNGIMTWRNLDVYRGEWKCGLMHGQGEYTWNNNSFNRSQKTVYVGEWHNGARHGKGLLTLNSAGRTKYSGYWENNKKHGGGIMIGNNGGMIEADPFFVNDVLVAVNASGSNLENKKNENQEQAPSLDEALYKNVIPPSVPITRPEQFPCFEYHIMRLNNLYKVTRVRQSSTLSGNSNVCGKNNCCAEPKQRSKSKNCNENIELENVAPNPKDTAHIDFAYEERWLRNCLTKNMLFVRQLYKKYSAMFNKTSSECDFGMCKLGLWQLWRDSGINRKKCIVSLVNIDEHIAKNPFVFIKDAYSPFEKIEIWQFIHILIEVSWHLYTKQGEFEINDMNGKLASGLQKLLVMDLSCVLGKHTRNVWQEAIDLSAIYNIFDKFKQIEYPPRVVTLLRFIFSTKDHKLLEFQQLGITRIMDIIVEICPLVKDSETGVIVNEDYKITFLEFCELILESKKNLVLKTKSRTETEEENCEET